MDDVVEARVGASASAGRGAASSDLPPSVRPLAQRGRRRDERLARLPALMRATDPRWFQIASLSSLLVWGVFGLSFDVVPTTCLAIVATAQACQWLCTRVARAGPFDPRSALISSLSLCLLLRTNDVRFAVLAAVLTIVPKFVLRIDGKHVLNPTNGAIAMLLAAGAPVWVSPGQWGNFAFFAFLLLCAGTMTVTRSARIDVVISFLVAWSALVIGRSLWLGEPMAIPLHRLQSGSLLLFAFFMISDPKTTPDARLARIVFACVVALGAWIITFRWFRTNGLLWSLVVCSLCVPVLDRLVRGARFSWTSSSNDALSSTHDALAPGPVAPEVS